MLIPPHSEENEKAVIAQLLFKADELSRARDEGLHANHFYGRVTQSIYESISEMYDDGDGIDPISISEHLKDKQERGFTEAEIYPILTEIQDMFFHQGEIRTYARNIIKDYNSRKIIEATQEASACAQKGDNCEALTLMSHVSLDERVADKTIYEHGQEFIADCEEGRVGHLDWWCDEWTAKLGKLSNEIVMLSAPRSTGKTALMLQAMNKNHSSGFNTPLASIEMEKRELVPRMIAHKAQISTFLMRSRGYVTPDEGKRARASLEAIKRLNYDVREHGASIEDLRLWALSKEADAFWYDNLLSINDGGKQYQSKTVMYDSFLREFREIRDKTGKPQFILCHPNSEGKIAWSTDVENFADIILHLQNIPEDGLTINGTFIAQRQDIGGKHVVGIFKKNRQGIQPVASLEFDGPTQTFNHLGWVID